MATEKTYTLTIEYDNGTEVVDDDSGKTWIEVLLEKFESRIKEMNINPDSKTDAYIKVKSLVAN